MFLWCVRDIGILMTRVSAVGTRMRDLHYKETILIGRNPDLRAAQSKELSGGKVEASLKSWYIQWLR